MTDQQRITELEASVAVLAEEIAFTDEQARSALSLVLQGMLELAKRVKTLEQRIMISGEVETVTPSGMYL